MAITTVSASLIPEPTHPDTEPIINSPYREPDWHWQLNYQAKAISPALLGRRISQNVSPVAGSRNVTRTEPEGFGAQWVPLDLVNRVRELVDEWGQQDYPGVTWTTRRLIDHWIQDDSERVDSTYRRFFYAQLDAALTHIYVKEVAPPQIIQELDRINAERNDGISRLAHKMATGTGKTLVMAMLIVWQSANYHANPNDERFTRRFLLLTPGLTVKERLESSLIPNRQGNDYTEFGILPPGEEWEQALNLIQIRIANYHQFESRSVGATPSSNAQDLLNGDSSPPTPEEIADRRESPAEIVERVTDGRSNGTERIMVINDESHHCHRGTPGGTQKNTQWFDGLTYIRDVGLLHYVTDMSATPIYISQSNPKPVEWIVSDYSLVDAIEAGLVKIPQVPTGTGRGQHPRFRDIFNETDSRERRNFKPFDHSNNALLKEALAALCEEHRNLTGKWQETYDNRLTGYDLDEVSEPQQFPVMAIVMNSVGNANAMFEYVSSGASSASLLCNYTHPGGDELLIEPRTIIVHSKLEEGKDVGGDIGKHIKELAEVYRRHPKYGFTEQDKPGEIIRRVMNTVGRPGQPGESVKCVISVSMLTEGWDARTVTHILGFRAFGSSLLCEQVAGRTLRRVTHDFDYTGQRFIPEYARILGIPFPQYDEPPMDGGCSRCGHSPCACAPLPTVDVSVKANRPDLRIEWPNVVRFRRVRGQNTVAVNSLPSGPVEDHEVVVRSRDTTILEGQVGPELEIQAREAISREHFLFQVAGQTTKTIIDDLVTDETETGTLPYTLQANRLFGQTLRIVQGYAKNGHLIGPSDRGRWPEHGPVIARAAQWLHLNVSISKPSHNDGPVLDAVTSTREPWLSTDTFRPCRTVFDTERVYGRTRKSHISYAVCDSSWETEVARQLDEMPEITRWVRNHNLNWSIPYVVDGEQYRYLPDFVAVSNLSENLELNVVIEVKGKVYLYDPDKRRWAQQYWVPAVNRHPEYGLTTGKLWDYLYLDDLALVQDAGNIIADLIAKHRG